MHFGPIAPSIVPQERVTERDAVETLHWASSHVASHAIEDPWSNVSDDLQSRSPCRIREGRWVDRGGRKTEDGTRPMEKARPSKAARPGRRQVQHGCHRADN
jgi:hypothetical protein